MDYVIRIIVFFTEKVAYELRISDWSAYVCSSDLKPVVLYFYPKDDTSGCTKEAVEFSAASAKFDKLGAVVIGCSRDSVASHDKFKIKHKLRSEERRVGTWCVSTCRAWWSSNH